MGARSRSGADAAGAGQLRMAPRSAASRAFSTTMRASSTQQSEYSNAAREYSGFSGAPAGIVPQSASVRVGGRDAAAEMVVEKQAQPQQPGGPQPRVMRQHEAQRPDHVRRHRPQYFPLLQRFTHEPELAMFEVAQPAVDQFGRRR